MEVVLIFLTSIVNLVVAIINLIVASKDRKRKKDPRSAKRKS